MDASAGLAKRRGVPMSELCEDDVVLWSEREATTAEVSAVNTANQSPPAMTVDEFLSWGPPGGGGRWDTWFGPAGQPGAHRVPRRLHKPDPRDTFDVARRELV
jgi:hypothetical protein